MEIKMIDQFPEDFMFGSSSSAFQFEGAWREDGRGESNYDHVPRAEGVTDFEIASDHYHRYREDIALLKELGLEAYRFSMSWARILPDGKTVNPKAIDFYNDLLNEIVEAGMEPIVTIYHFEFPQALVDDFGGWISRESVDAYVHFAQILFENFGDRVKYWLTINEQDHLVKFRERLGLPKESRSIEDDQAIHQANYYMCLATAKVIHLAKEFRSDVMIGPAVNPMPAYPKSNHPKDVLAAQMFEELSHYYVLDLHIRGYFSPVYWKYLTDRGLEPEVCQEELDFMAENPPNYLGVNYYMNQTVERTEEKGIAIRPDGVFVDLEPGIYQLADNPYLGETESGWSISDDGLFIGMLDLYNRYQLPMLVTENGLGASDTLTEDGRIHDIYRIEYERAHLHQLKRLISFGVPVLGYCSWSAIDLVSGREGMNKRYGYIYVNRDNFDLKDLRRIKKDSFYWYQKVIRSRGKEI